MDNYNKIKDQYYQMYSNIKANANTQPAYQTYGTNNRMNNSWFSGSQPTSWEIRKAIGEISLQDQDKGNELYNQWMQEQMNPNSPYYNKYATTTNKAKDELAALGVNADDFTLDWFKSQEANDFMNTYLERSSTSDSAKAPTKKSSRENQIAYWLDKWGAGEAKTQSAEKEYQDIMDKANYMAGDKARNYSDDEIIQNIYGVDGESFKKNYPTLYEMYYDNDPKNYDNDYKAIMLNRAIDFSEDMLRGSMWAARNDGGTGNAELDTIMAAMGAGNTYKENPEITAKLEPLNPDNTINADYHPYSVGSTIAYEDALFFGIYGADDEWLEQNKRLKYYGTEEEQKHYNNIETAVNNQHATDMAEKTIYDYAEFLLNKSDDLNTIKNKIDTVLTKGKLYVKTDKNGNVRYSEKAATGYEEIDLGILNDIDRSIGKNIGKENQINPSGDLVPLSIGTNYKYDNMMGELDKAFEKKSTQQKSTEYASGVATDASTKAPAVPAEGVDAVSGADRVYKPGQQDAVIEAQDKVLGESADIVAPVATEAEYAGIKNSWSMAFDLVKDTWDKVSNAIKPDSAIMAKLVKNSVGTMTTSILKDSDVVQQYNIYNGKLPELEKEKAELEAELGNLVYKKDEAFDYDKWDGKLESQPAWNTLSKEQQERLKEYETIFDVEELAGYFNSEVNKVAVTEEQQERINRYQDVLFNLNEANGYMEQNLEAYDAAVKRTENEKKKTQTVIDMLKRNGVDTTELENAQTMGDFYLAFNQYDPTTWSEYNVYHAYSQIVYSGVGGIDEMLEIAQNDDDEIQKYIELAQWSLDYADENNIQLPDNIRENITRWMESMQRQHEDFEYLTLLEADDFKDKVKAGREMAADMYEFDWEAYRENPTLEAQPMWNLLSDEQKQTLLEMQDIYDINDVANQFTTYMNTMDIENGLFGNYRLKDLLTDYEADTFYYLLATEGLEGAMTYKDHLTDSSYGVLNSRAATKTRENADALASSGFFGRRAADLLSALLSPVSAVESFVYTADYALKKLRGERVEFNPENISLSANIYKKEARQKINEEIDKVYGKDTVLGKVMSGLQEIISNRLDSVADMVAFGPLFSGISSEILQEFMGALPMAYAAATDAVADAKAKGANDTQMLGIFLSTLLSESVTEAISISNIRDAFKMGLGNAGAGDVAAFLKNWLTDSGISEMVGESINDVVENLAADLWTPDSSEYKELVAHYINDEHMTEEEARDMAGKDMMMGLLHTALISYLSPGMDIVSYAAGRYKGRASMAKEYQQHGYNDVNVFNVMRYDKQRRQDEVDALRTLITESQTETGEQAAAGEQVTTGEQAVTTQNVEAPAENTNIVKPDTGAPKTTQSAPPVQGDIQTVNAPETTGEAVNETVSVDRYTADYTALDSAKQEGTVSQTGTIASVLDMEKTNESGDMAKAAAERLDTLPGGEDRIELMTDLVVGAEESQTDLALVKQAVMNAVLGGEQSAAWQMMNSSEYIHADLGQKAALLASTVEQDAANAAVQESIAKEVHESRVNAVERDLIANGALKETQKQQESLNKAEKEAADAQKSLDEKQQALDEALADVGQKAQAVKDNPTDDNIKQHADAVARANSADESRKQYEQHLQKVESDRARAEAELNRIRNEEMTAVRKEAEATVAKQDQQRVVDAAAKAEAKRKQDAHQAEVERQQKIADQRSGKTAEESAWAKIMRLAEARGYVGEQAEKFANDVMNYWKTGQVNKVDLSKQFSKAEGYLMMGALSRRFGINVEITDIPSGENGFYNPNTNTITLNSNLPAGQILVEFALHELTHSLEKTGSYQQYHDTVLGMLYPSEAEMNDAVAKKMAEYDEKGHPIDETQAKRELVAEFTRLRLNNKEVVQRMVDSGMGGWIRNALHNVNQFLKNIKLTGEERTEAENLRRTERLFQKAIRDRSRAQAKARTEAIKQANTPAAKIERSATPVVENNQGDAEVSEVRGGTISRSDGDTEYSVASWTDEEKARIRNQLKDRMMSENDGSMTEEEMDAKIDKWVEDVNSVASIILSDQHRLDYDVTDQNKRFLKDNQDYIYTLDASTLCAKRLLFQGTFDTIQRMLPNTPLLPEDLIDLANMMRDMGYETPCGICYVESRRRWLGKYANEWLSSYDGEYIPTIQQLTTSDGLEELRKNHPEAYESFTSAMRAKGSANPKVVQLRTDYRGDIDTMTPGEVQKVIDIGGLRIQSFSDFEVPHLIDMMQAILDMTAKGLTSQAYTKVPAFAAVFGDTGIKINLSEIGKDTGISIDNGLTFDEIATMPYDEAKELVHLLYDDIEGMPHDQAIALRNQYSKNVGTILVGMNDAHIIAAMADGEVDFIIPFHKSGWSQDELNKMPVLNSYDDYTNTQNERIIIGKKTKKETGKGQKAVDNWIAKNGDKYKDYKVTEEGNGKYTITYTDGYETESFQKHKERTGEKLGNFEPVGANQYWDFSKNGQENAEAYLEMCKKEGRIPKFSQFLVDNGDGSFSLPQGDDFRSTAIREGYWKTLIDFKMYDNEGNGSEQTVVTPNVNMDAARDVLNNYSLSRQMPNGQTVTREDNNTLPVAQEVVDAYVQKYKDEHPGREYSVNTAEMTDAQKAQALQEAGIDYQNAVARGDMEAAQEDVDFYAEQAFADSKIRDEDGNLMVVYHGTMEQFTQFDMSKSRINMDIQGSFFSPWEIEAGGYGENVGKYYLNIQNPAPEGVAYAALNRYKGQNEAGKKAREYLISQGYDGVANYDEFIAFYPEQIKSADPVTYDDNGNVIPLDQRFSDSNDIRYSTGNDQMTDAERRQALIDAGLMTQEEANALPLEGQNPTMSTAQGPAKRAFGQGMLQGSEMDRFAQFATLAENSYFPDTNADQINRAIEWIRSNKQSQSSNGLYESLEKINSKNFDYRSADGQARMVAVMAMAVAKDDVMAQVALADAFNRQGTDLGRALQARKLFRMMTPEGRISTIRKMINNAQAELESKGYEGKPLEFSDWIYQAAAAATEDGDMEKVYDAAKLELAQQIPANWKEKVVALRMFAMLSSPKTHLRNVIGNTLMIPLVGTKNKIGALGEIVLQATGQIKPGERTKTLRLRATPEARQFATQDLSKVRGELDGSSKYKDSGTIKQTDKKMFGRGKGILSRTFGKALQGWMDFNSNALEWEDKVFLNRNYRNAMAAYMTANKFTAADMKGDTLQKARKYAIQEAMKATFHDASAVANWLNSSDRPEVARFIVDALLPFKKTPINIGKRGIEYSPISIIDGLSRSAVRMKQYMDYQNGNRKTLPVGAISPQQWIDKMAAGATGVGLMALGFILGKLGFANAGFDDDDPEDQIKKMRNEQEYSINPGKIANAITDKLFGVKFFGEDSTYTLDWASPSVLPVMVGVAMSDATDEFESDGNVMKRFLNALSGITEPMFNMTLLEGLNSTFESSPYDTDGNFFTNTAKKMIANYVSSFIPSIISQGTKTFDSVKRSTFVKSGEEFPTAARALEQIENKLPWLCETNTPYVDAFGREERKEDAGDYIAAFFQNFVSPGNVSHIDQSKKAEEIERLYRSTKDKNVVIKNPAKYFEITDENGTVKEKIVLDDKQYYQMKKTANTMQGELLDKLVETDFYDKADDATRAKMMKNIYQYSLKVAQHEIDSRVSMDDWMRAAMGDGYVIEHIVDQVETDNRNAYIKSGAANIYRGLMANDQLAVESVMEDLESKGISNKELKTQLSKFFGPVYKEAYQKGEEDTMENIEDMLIDLDIGYGDKKDKTFDNWIKSVDNKTEKYTISDYEEDEYEDEDEYSNINWLDRKGER